IWVSDEEMTPEEVLRAAERGYLLPEEIRIIGVDLSGKPKTSQGVGKVSYYPDSYTDPARIHLEKNGKNRYSIIIEPFLSKVIWNENTAGR
ncbi:MAG: hypothetical protein AB1659_07690, partial [Thermodesulfobacteriota bacterium]